MARRQVLEVVCDRCGRTETQDLNSSPKQGREEHELRIEFHGKVTTYDDLCLRCRRASENYIKSLRRETEESKENGTESQPEPEKKKGLFGGKS